MPRKKNRSAKRNPNGTSSIYYSEYDGLWHGRVTVGVKDNGKPDRRHVKRHTEPEVIDAVRKLERERDTGKTRKPGRAMTVEQWLTHWVENIAAPSVRPNTLVGYRAAVYGHLIPGIGAHRLDKLQPEHLEKLYSKLATKKGKHGKLLRPATIHQAHRTIRTALNEAVRRRHIATNPAQIAKAPRIPDEEVIPFTKEEAGRIQNVCASRRNGVRFVVALTLGLRKGEALGLQWRDIDLNARVLMVRRSIQPVRWKHGCPAGEPCGRHPGHCPQRYGGGALPQELKSRAGKRSIGIPDPLARALKEHHADQRREREQAGELWHDEGWVFASPTGKPIHPRTDHSEWKAVLKAAKVRDARLHDARHTAATMLLVLGVPSRAVMDVMGWSNIALTTRYQHITSDLTEAIADQVGGFFWSDDQADSDDEDPPEAAPVTA
ncbi:tyrosine-type recombinase/integrase [Sciscionella sediminilitoris]|uniref:tyrosine-type recombinase/integrase n=1 Tax=Sciscionella sediminilitoris TaxID=1445613 RepID=UPI0004DECC46|nr:site-specific integrase [Sciscionella sp. SE31]